MDNLSIFKRRDGYCSKVLTSLLTVFLLLLSHITKLILLSQINNRGFKAGASVRDSFKEALYLCYSSLTRSIEFPILLSTIKVYHQALSYL